MGTKSVACCYHPTTVVLIDDDKSYLQSLSANLGNNLPCKSFSNPQEALLFLKDQYVADPYTNRCIVHAPEDSPLRRNIEIDVKLINEEVFNANRFGEISVIVVDQVMPGLKGLKLCEELSDRKFKKILLTGQAEDKDVIDAFNSGIIDKYVPKDSRNLSDIIKDNIKELQNDYFDGLSSIVLNSLTEDKKNNHDSCLGDPNFVEFFKNLLKEKSIAEYYLTDPEGSFLLLDADGKPSILVVKDSESMISTYEIANLSNQKSNTEVLEKLKNKKLILYLHSLSDLKLEPKDWEKRKFMHPANKLIGKNETYYYAYIDNLKDYDINHEKMVSFHEYLDQLD